MAEKVSVKSNALGVLEKQLQLRAKKGQYGIVVLSSATDPYLHFEAETLLTRQILELILKYRFPLHVITRSDLVVRDFDLLAEINRSAILPPDLQGRLDHGTFITFSFSTLDNAVAKIFEPGATTPDQRLKALKAALSKGFHSGVSLMPLIPYISDTGEHLDLMFKTFKETGIHYIFPATITLFGNSPSDSRTLVLRAIERHYPHLLEKYRKLFENQPELPAYYREAFYKKTRALSLSYGLRNSILNP